VDQQVCGEGGRPLERLPALFALENLLDVVNSSATRQGALNSGSVLMGHSEVLILNADTGEIIRTENVKIMHAALCMI
jgi:hypothetical protein